MTKAADRFTNAALLSWSLDEFRDTADMGLSDPDKDTLRHVCADTGEDFRKAESEVVAFCREKTGKN